MKTKKVIFLSLVMVLTTGFFLVKGEFRHKSSPSEIFFEKQKGLGRLISSQGIYKAYAYFRRSFNSYEPSTKHYLGHYLGQEAYKILGEKGFDVCDFGLDYGCIHGFVISGISERGKGFFNTVMNECVKIDPSELKRGSCIHGVSHTILSLKGYSFTDLKWALGECDNLLKDKYEGPDACYSAVFMEYNLRSLDGDKNGDWFITRPLDTQKPLHPCDVLEEKYQWACFSEMSSFWANNIGANFEQMAGYCNSIGLENSEKGCFWGLGRTTSDLYKYEVGKIGIECQKISPQEMLYSCLEGASVVLLNNGVSGASHICNYNNITTNKNSCKDFFFNNQVY